MFSEDKILIHELKKGNEKAYKHLYNAYYKRLLVYCLGLTNNLPMAEDIVQNTYIKIWTNKDRITITTSLKSYLFRSVYNNFISEYNKKQKETAAIEQMKFQILNNLIELNDDVLQNKLRALEHAIDELPKKCKSAFILHKKQGYSYKEIAMQMNISERTVEKHISRAISRIKKSLYKKSSLISILFWLTSSLRSSQKHFATSI
ncbi:RNA polymerase sigma factor [Snuella sedimenti]|uniref:RNA polymerase sigma-70 factor n=1 Tax=Snuella sedimenti TaxID=2798802 RepID=A0A8J7LY15_9FLAO|nr:RNA polymerase sigma-70 factor [Snuella sedimenti]MBJ6367781.1 RNA polymerase sigma-70 factor [Snuella sedimenti]